ncbi:GAF domain-containing protein [Pedobacter sp. MR2016-24]|uniref:GAF domain-containing protein n=1 Tax=Pedobacter sp. MR2016-24 TaxID=2994466 RepID=UPI0022455C97|nr:GAF domain-containing protein [Pedobacter sp. MR2016-24]MCX2484764.1 GAF domain-containing protein [Pedobacter sp. MR2016-24]
MQLPLNTDTPFQIQVSFDQLLERLEKVAADPANDQHVRAKSLLEEAASCPELRTGITDVAQIEDNRDLIRRLLADLIPEALTLNEIKAVSMPYRDFMFNRTQRFKNILRAAGPDFKFNIRGFDEHQFYVLSCCLILNEFYGTRLDFSKPLFYDIPTADSITKHYRILYNAEHLDIVPTDKVVPITAEDIDLLTNNYEDLALWKSKFPKESYILKGFAIMSLYDATVENAVSLLKEKLIGLNTVRFQQSVEAIFRSIYQIAHIEIGFTLFISEENKFKVASFGQPMKSFIIPDHYAEADKEMLCTYSYQRLIEDKVYFAISDVLKFQSIDPSSDLAQNFLAKNIHSFILAPIIKNGVLLGVFEVVSPKANDLNSVNANKLEVVMPFLTESIERLVNEYQVQVQAIIQDYYTTIHSSVYWKFKAAAQQYLDARQSGRDYNLPEVIFKNVFPLYGQADIKGSSDARNMSVQKDLRKQMNALLHLLELLQPLASFHEELKQVEIFLHQLEISVQANTEQQITTYLNGGLLLRLKKITDPECLPLISSYFAESNQEKGDFYTYRRKYETTVSLINEKMAHIIDKRQTEAQALFPHYYERFKSDGVEHNLYIGSSILPSQQFEIRKLYDLRLWQLRVLCEMELAHYHLKSQLPYQLEVTTLVLVYHTPIDIRFRMDEKRFDVDGTYNARFEIVKKRIDKAHIKHSLERITAVGKLTIVYSSDTEEQEYRNYIQILQQDQVLGTHIEKFEVEDLQGISGLKGLRVVILRPSSLS